MHPHKKSRRERTINELLKLLVDHLHARDLHVKCSLEMKATSSRHNLRVGARQQDRVQQIVHDHPESAHIILVHLRSNPQQILEECKRNLLRVSVRRTRNRRNQDALPKG